jgi:hypothetical protein
VNPTGGRNRSQGSDAAFSERPVSFGAPTGNPPPCKSSVCCAQVERTCRGSACGGIEARVGCTWDGGAIWVRTTPCGPSVSYVVRSDRGDGEFHPLWL